jgi:hypothetical protein
LFVVEVFISLKRFGWFPEQLRKVL